MNGHMKRKRKSKFEHLNQSLLFDQLVNRSVAAHLLFSVILYRIEEDKKVELSNAIDL